MGAQRLPSDSTSHAVSLTTLTASPSMRTVTATTTEHVAGAEKISVKSVSCLANRCRNLQLCSEEVYNISSVHPRTTARGQAHTT